ncbi:MAG TPA: GNAT family N-acetyltransferase [Burkholderiaceae bacterium]|jgi:ribosomal protein S18 acetylase RimI-like enzyme|nr:GNAT family N-acetyltransferase [Burkholderiaceae bacterium]
MKKILVREAAFDDIRLIADLTRACWSDKGAPTSSAHHETEARVDQDLRSGGGFILLVDGIPAGSVRWIPLDAESDIWQIMRMGVLPAYRGHNLSQNLLEAVIHHALASDVRELRLGVRSDQSRLVNLYAAYGFEVAPELEHFHANSLEPAPIVMRRLLR